MLRGCEMERISFAAYFTSKITLDTLKPPPVLPAQAPINIRSIRMVFDNRGQVLKSVVAYPVVETIEATWKTEFLIASDILLDIDIILTVIAVMLINTIEKFNIKNIFDDSGKIVLECVATGLLKNSLDNSFSDFKGIAQEIEAITGIPATVPTCPL